MNKKLFLRMVTALDGEHDSCEDCAHCIAEVCQEFNVEIENAYMYICDEFKPWEAQKVADGSGQKPSKDKGCGCSHYNGQCCGGKKGECTCND